MRDEEFGVSRPVVSRPQGTKARRFWESYLSELCGLVRDNELDIYLGENWGLVRDNDGEFNEFFRSQWLA